MVKQTGVDPWLFPEGYLKVAFAHSNVVWCINVREGIKITTDFIFSLSATHKHTKVLPVA